MDELRELYIEPTSHCNLNCVMCSRNRWENETRGHMELALFDKIMEEIPEGVTRIFFGGVGEPLYHPDILYMVRRAKETRRRVEMITNGTLLDGEMSDGIVKAGLDMLWVSLDSMEEGSYETIRFGAKFGGVMENIRTFNERRFIPQWLAPRLDKARVKLGVAFVLMKKNLEQYKRLLAKAQELGIAEVKATHLIPYDETQIREICYERLLWLGAFRPPTVSSIHVDMPFLDPRDVLEHDMLSLFSNQPLSFSIMGRPLRMREDYCRFVQEGIVFVRWDGDVSPCMALLHENKVYLQDCERRLRHCSYGSANDKSLREIWESESYAAFRQRVLNFEFSPCSRCAACDLFETNEEDCFGNPFPTCGPCLWAQGLFQCP